MATDYNKFTRRCRMAAQTARRSAVTIGELGDYSDPATGLEHHLAVGCTSDAEKEAMRRAVLVALAKIGNRELEALSQAFREDTQRYIKERGG